MKKLISFFVTIFILVSVFASDKDGVFGIYRLVLHEKSGTFSLYQIDPSNEKYVAVLNPLDNSSGTILYLKSGSKIYPLSKQAGVAVTQEMTETNASITYTVKNVASVVLNFTFCSSQTGIFEETSDIAIVDIIVNNIGKKTKIVSLKGVFDTCLGETIAQHFSTKTLPIINSEAVFNSMYADKWLQTSNGKNKVRFLLDGETITRPVSVVVANKDILATDVWEPKLIPGRGFNSLFSLNNSAIGITWNSYKLAPEKLCGVRFYISASSTEEDCADATSEFFTSGKAVKSASFLADSDKLVAEEVIQYVVLSTQDKDDESNFKSVDESTADKKETEEKEKTESEVKETNSVEVAPVAESPKTEEMKIEITPEKLDQSYIESLINQIDELEKNSDEYDIEKIQRLNAELDAILEHLKQ